MKILNYPNLFIELNFRRNFNYHQDYRCLIIDLIEDEHFWHISYYYPRHGRERAVVTSYKSFHIFCCIMDRWFWLSSNFWWSITSQETKKGQNGNTRRGGFKGRSFILPFGALSHKDTLCLNVIKSFEISFATITLKVNNPEMEMKFLSSFSKTSSCLLW